MQNALSSPVLFLVYARPNTTRLVFEEIRKARPKKLYIAADGPKPGRDDIAGNCAKVRELVSKVDWDCTVSKFFREQNAGCKIAVSEAISWFFSQEEEGIILEDDCLPDQSFFFFCQSLLEKYRHDERIMHISGVNLQFGRKRGNSSYYFSNIPTIWGWAAWKRTWDLFDINMRLFPEFKETKMIKNVLADEETANTILKVLQLNYENKIITWDHQYGFSIVINNGLCITPNVNLVSNLGFSKKDDPFEKNKYFLSNMVKTRIDFPLVHPKFFVPNKEADLLQVSWDIYDSKKRALKRLKKKYIYYPPVAQALYGAPTIKE